MKKIPVTLDIFDDGNNRMVEVDFVLSNEENLEKGLKRIWKAAYKTHTDDTIEIELIEYPEKHISVIDKPSEVSTPLGRIEEQFLSELN